jgi:predicted O-methyltransferase YrrM
VKVQRAIAIGIGSAEGTLALRTKRLWPSGQSLAAAQAELAEPYREYITSVSAASMAVSLQTAAYLLWLCRHTDARGVLDLGSGFSSYVLSHYAASSPAVRVVSVDDDTAWLDRTREFLARTGLREHELCSWDEFRQDGFDVVFHDLASGAKREAAMPTALSAGRIVLFDDMQHDGHRRAAQTASRSAGRRLHSLRSITLDAINRFAAVAC